MNRFLAIITTLSLIFMQSAPVFGASANWNVDSAGNWNTDANWSPASAPGSTSSTANTDTATFDKLLLTTDRTVTVDTNRNIGNITFGNTSSQRYTLSGGNLLLTDGGVIQTAAGNGNHTDIISSAITIQGNGGVATFTAGATSAASLLSIGGITGVSAAGNTTTLTLNGSNTGANIITGIIGDGSGLGKLAIVKSGAGAWSMSGANTYTGGTTLAAGTLLLGNNAALGTGTLTLNGGTLSSSTGTARTLTNTSVVGGDFILGQASTGALTLSGTMDLGGAVRGITVNNTSDTISGVISGTGGITKAGTGRLILSGVNTYTGKTTVNAGTLSLGVETGLGGNPGAFAADQLKLDGGTLQATATFSIDDSNRGVTLGGSGGTISPDSGVTLTIANVITGAGSLTKAGAGRLTLSGANTYTGATTVNAGTLRAGVITNAFGNNSAVALADTSGATLDLYGFNNTIGSLSGGGASGGNVTLGNATLTIGGNNTSPSAYAGVISGTGAVTKVGTGKLILSGVNTYTGKTTVNAGTLSIGAETGLGGNPGAFAADQLKLDGGTLQATATFSIVDSNRGVTLGGSGGTISPDSSRTLTITNVITGAGSLAKTGAGTLTLSGANTYTGATTINAGKIILTNSSGLGTSAAGTSVADNTSLQLSGGITVANEALTLYGDISSSCNLWNISGNNTWGGDITITKTSVASDYSIAGVNSIGGNAGTFTISGGISASTVINPDTPKTLALNPNNSSTRISVTGIISDGNASNPLNILVAGTGRAQLRGANTYTGFTTIGCVEFESVGGYLEAYGGNAIGDLSAVQFYNTAGTRAKVLELKDANETVGSIATSASNTGPSIVLNAYRLTTGGDDTNTTFSGVISGALGSLTKAGTGTLTLSGVNTYTGGTTIGAGTLSVANSSALGLEANLLTIGGGATLQATDSFNTSRGTTLGGVGSGAGGTFEIDVGKTLEYTSSSVISGTGSLIKTGAGTLSLAGINTYSGGTYIEKGTVISFTNQALGPAPTQGTNEYAIHLYDGATLQIASGSWSPSGGYRQIELVEGTGDATIDITDGLTSIRNGRIYGDGTLNLVGIGTMIFKNPDAANENTYTGGTIIENGTLQVNNTFGSATGTGNVTVKSGGTLSDLTAQGGSTGTTGSLTGTVEVQSGGELLTLSGGTLTLGGLTLDAGALSTFQLGALTATRLVNINGLNSFTLEGASTVDIVNIGSMTAGTYSLFDYAGDALADISNLTLASTHIGSFTLALVHNIGNTSIDLSVTPDASRWTGATGSTWSTADNWSPTVVPDGAGTDVDFIDGLSTSTIDTSKTVGSMTFNNSTTAFTISASAGQTLTLNNSGSSAVIQVLSAPGTANHVISAPVILADNLTVDISAGTYGLDISGGISESAAGRILSKTGSGPLTLSGTSDNTYTGLTEVVGGTLNLNKTAGVDAIGSGGLQIDYGATAVLLASNQINDGSTVTVNGTFAMGTFSETITTLVGGGTVTTGNGSVLTLGGAADYSFIGIISGTGGIAKAGTGTLTLTGVNTYSGGTTINAGTLQAGADNNLGNSSGAITFGGGTLSFSGGFTSARNIILTGAGTLDTDGSGVSLAGEISGGGTITKDGAGTIKLTGVNTYTGATIINNGILRISNAVSLGSTSGVTVNTNGELELDGDGLTVDRLLTLNGGEICNLANTNTYSGAITLAADSIADADAGTLNITGAIGGAFGLTKEGSGTVTLSKTNTYTGSTAINEGILKAGVATNAFGINSAITLADTAGAILDLNDFSNTIGSLNGGGATGGDVDLGSATLTTGNLNTADNYAGAISGTGGLTKDGANTMTLSGANTYTGVTTVSAGTLRAGAVTNAFGDNSAVVLANTAGAVLDLNDFSNTIGSLSGGGASGGNVTLGDATLTIGGDNTSPSAYSGVISGTGAIIKEGTGTLTLSGANTYSGTTTIIAGILQVRNTNAVGGAIGGALINNATLDVGTTSLIVNGDYTQGAATLALTASSATIFGNIVVTGATTVPTTATVAVTVGGYMPNGTTLRVVDGAGGGVALPSTITSSNSKYSFTGAADGNDLVLTVNRGGAGAGGFFADATNINEAAVANVLDNMTNPSADMLTVLNTLDGLSSAQVTQALASLNPTVDTGVTMSSTNMINTYIETITRRMEYILTPKVAPGMTGVSTGGDYIKGVDVWGQVFGNYSQQAARGISKGYNATMWGVAFGGDVPTVSDNLRFGIAPGYAQSFVRSKDSSGRTDINSYQGTVYGGYQSENHPYYADCAFSLAYNDYNGSRHITAGPAIDRIADADYNGQQYSVMVGGGYTFKANNFNLTPLVSVQYMRLHINGYTETGANALNLIVNSQDYDMLQTGFGAKLEYPVATKSGTLVPEIHFKWLYDWIGDKQADNSTFSGGGAAFPTTGFTPAVSSYDFGARLMLFTKNSVSIAANYDIEIKEDYWSQTALLETKYKF